MKVATTRFGDMEVGEEDVLLFREGILGFESLTKFFVVDPGDDTLIMWLQSIEDRTIAFPILEPQVFKQDYNIGLLPSERRSLELENNAVAKVYIVLTIPKDVTQISANLKAPIVINDIKRIARQIVLQDNSLSVRHEIYKELKAHIVTMANMGVNEASFREDDKRDENFRSNKNLSIEV